ncbi:DUF721 domain-containing protein [Thiosocius teredinicola]|uniref:DUF721 domain-containing protein n=1 Tax=Thiosocius teredinicola TaxID=1973002 RepID=UPI0013DE3DEA
MSHNPKSVRHLLKDKPTLRFLEREISAQKTLLAQVRQCLPVDLANHCLAAQFREQRLVLHTDSPVWATRLRYLAPEIASLLRLHYPNLQSVSIKMLIPQIRRSKKPRRAVRSDVAAEIIHETAAETKQPQLREALKRLGDALKRSK